MKKKFPNTTVEETAATATHYDTFKQSIGLGNLLAALTQKNGSILPSQTKSGRSLTIVVSTMCYLAVLAIIANILIYKSVETWTSDVAKQVTVQLKPVDGESMDEQIKNARTILDSTPGISSTSILSNEESLRLLEPWLGGGSLLADLPVPRLISVVIDEANPPDFKSLSQRLTTQINGASLDTHRRWQGQILRTASALRLISLGVLALISITTIAIIIFATRAAMASNQEVISVLHLVGAHDNFVAGEVQSRFFMIGLKSGLFGVVFGMLTYITLGLLSTSYLGTETTQSGFHFLYNSSSIGVFGFLGLFTVPISAVIICIISSRIVVLRMLSGVL